MFACIAPGCLKGRDDMLSTSQTVCAKALPRPLGQRARQSTSRRCVLVTAKDAPKPDLDTQNFRRDKKQGSNVTRRGGRSTTDTAAFLSAQRSRHFASRSQGERRVEPETPRLRRRRRREKEGESCAERGTGTATKLSSGASAGPRSAADTRPAAPTPPSKSQPIAAA